MSVKRRVLRYLLNHAIALDQWANVCVGGDPDETISSRVGRNASEGQRFASLAEVVIDALFRLLGQRGHCRLSIERCHSCAAPRRRRAR